MNSRLYVAAAFFALLVAAAPLPATSAQAAPAQSASRERRLHVATAEASSYLVNDWNRFSENYLPLYIGDDDRKTAWTLKTQGIGEWIRLRVTPMEGATKVRLKVRNGYQKSKTLFAANSRARTVKLVLLPSKVEATIELKDVGNWQEATVEQPAGALEGVQLHLLSVYPGSKYDDVCLSDVQMFVTATTPENPAYEKQRFAKIQTWKKERLAAAKLFQTTFGKALPVAAAYSSVPEQQPVKPNVAVQNECKDESCQIAFTLKTAIAHARNKEGKNTTPPGLATALSLASAGFNGMQPVRLSSRDKRALPRVDGLCSFQLDECLEDPCPESLPVPGQLGFLNAQSLLVVEQKGLPSVNEVLSLAPAACHRSHPSTFAWITRDPPSPDGRPGIVKAVLLIICGMVEGREERYPKASSQLLVYDGNGSLDVLASENYAAVFTWDGTGATPKLARGQVTRNADEPAWTVQAATLVAGP